MPKHEKYPEEAEAAMRAASDEMERLDNARAIAEERLESLERDIDAAYEAGDTAAQSAAEQAHQQLERELADINSDLDGAERYLHQQHDYWGFDK